MPTQILVKDGAGNVVGRTDFAYDTTSLNPINGAANHDDQAYGATMTTRGDLTSMTRYANAAAGSGGITRTFNYDTVGNEISGQLDCCNQKMFNYSALTQYAYLDSIVTGPGGGPQFTTAYTWNIDNGLMLTEKDENLQTTTFQYDDLGRPTITTFPNSASVTNAYDDASGSPSVSVSNNANGAIIVKTFDGLAQLIQVDEKNSGTIVSTTKNSYDAQGDLTESSAPFAPADTASYTGFTYDVLGRLTAVSPSSGQGVQYQYYGNTVTVTDPASKQRRATMDSLGRLVEVDEPGETFGGTKASGSLGISGSLQSKSGVGAQNPTSATGSVTVNGEEQCFTPPPPPTCRPPMICCLVTPEPEWPFLDLSTESVALALQAICDSGTVSITVNGHLDQVSYANGSNSSTIASTLASAINGDTGAFVTTTASGSTVYLTSKTTGPNYSLSSSYTYDTSDFPASPSFTTTNSGSTLTGGSYGSGGTTVYDAGTVSITVGAFSAGNTSITGSEKSKIVSTRYCAMWNLNGDCVDWEFDTSTVYDSGTVTLTVSGHADSTAYAQGSDINSIATSLAQIINADSGSFVTATSGANGLTLTARQAGTAGSYSWSLSVSSDDPTDFGATGSFAAAPASGTLAGGSSNVFSTSISYGPNTNTSAAQVASALTSALNASGSPVTVSASGATLNITYNSLGIIGNVPATCSASTSQSAYFSAPSFSCSRVSLSGGIDPYASGLSHPYATTYVYDALNNLASISQAAGQVSGQSASGQSRTYSRDSLGRLTSSMLPESGTVTNYYTDVNGNACAGDPLAVCRVKDARGTISTFTYDAVNRVTAVQYSDGTPGQTFSFDTGGSSAYALGRLTKSTDGTNSKAFMYDQMGRITNVTTTIDSLPYSVGYAYNLAGEVSEITYPSNRTVNQSYDGIGRLSSLSSGSTNYLSSMSYNAAHQPTAFTYGNLVQGALSYNDHMELASIRFYSNGSANDVLNLSYDYGSANNGQVQGLHYFTSPNVEDLTKTELFTYDANYRVLGASTGVVNSTTGTWSLQEVYDRFGNRWQQNLTGGNPNAPGPSQPQLLLDGTTNRILNSGISYDAAGNMINDGTNRYAYDAANRLVQVNAGAASYAYFGSARVKKSVGSTTTVYVYSGTKPIAEYVNGALAKEYVYSGSQLLATIVSGSLIYHHRDHLSIRAQTDASGNVLRRYGHYPFGETWYETGTPDKWKPFTYENDSESGLDYASARFYSAGFGRFLSPDQIDGQKMFPQSFNHYSYVTNDPVNGSDPSGMANDIYHVCLLLDNGDNSSFCVGGFGFIDGMMTGFVGNPLQGDSFIDCNSVDCGQLGRTVTETDEDGNVVHSWTVKYDDDAGGPVWVNTLNGDEISPESAEELGLPELVPSGPSKKDWDLDISRNIPTRCSPNKDIPNTLRIAVVRSDPGVKGEVTQVQGSATAQGMTGDELTMGVSLANGGDLVPTPKGTFPGQTGGSPGPNVAFLQYTASAGATVVVNLTVTVTTKTPLGFDKKTPLSIDGIKITVQCNKLASFE